MALGDINIFDDGVFGPANSKRFKVNFGGPAGIKAGELVLKVLGNQSTAGSAGKGSYVTRWSTSSTTKPQVGTDFVAGLAASTSTETLTAAGVVDVFVNMPGMTYVGKPDTAATWNTQAKYDLLVGARVYLSTTSTGAQTILAADTTTTSLQNGTYSGITAGLIVEPLNIITYPGAVRFSLNTRLNYNQAQ